MAVAVRTLVLWCPDWPVLALGCSFDEPVAVVYANRVVAASPAARNQGVIRGLRKREAQARCVELTVHARDLSREAQTFEPVLAALDNVTPNVEVTRLGTCAFTTRGPTRYFGGEKVLTELVLSKTGQVIGELFPKCSGDAATDVVRVGVADGPFAALLAARSATPTRIVEPGRSPEFLAPMPISVLLHQEISGGYQSSKHRTPDNRFELVEVLARLGLNTLGAFAALKATDVLARFGNEGMRAYRLAKGLDEHIPTEQPPAPDWSVASEIDPPADRIDRVAFCARSLAAELQQRLSSEGVECTRIAIEAETEHGESMVRVWRNSDAGAFSAALITERVRWQLDGWLNGRASGSTPRPTGGITRVVLAPQEVIAADGKQLDFWGSYSAGNETNEADRRAWRVADRLQGQLGATAVQVPIYQGGRHHHEQLKLVPSADVELLGRAVTTSDTPNSTSVDGVAPWPGALPAPSPTQVLSTPHAVEVLDADSANVTVNGHGMLSSPPHWLVVENRPYKVVAWAGPWPIEERWWDDERRCRQARFQLLTDDGLARLVALEANQWQIVAIWD